MTTPRKLDESGDKLTNSVIIVVISIVAAVVLKNPEAWYAVLATIGMLIMWDLIEIKHIMRNRKG